MMILGVVAIIVLVYLFFRSETLGKRGSSSHTGNDSLAILKKRYAEGSITRDEYIQMKDVLNN